MYARKQMLHRLRYIVGYEAVTADRRFKVTILICSWRKSITEAGTDKAVFEALPKQFASPSSLHLPEALFERSTRPVLFRRVQAS